MEILVVAVELYKTCCYTNMQRVYSVSVKAIQMWELFDVMFAYKILYSLRRVSFINKLIEGNLIV